MTLSRVEKKERALDLFITGLLRDKEIAEIVCVSERAFRNWKKKYNWEGLREEKNQSKQIAIANMWKAIRAKTKDDDSCITNAKEIRMLSSTIAQHEKQLNDFSTIVQSAKLFFEWLKKENLEKAKEFNKLHLEFIISITKKQ
ncbi:MAG: helix-turn-helix domain-containing protein [Microscillaceae bacterium]|nr:helix-turn-helix domain-containing protein [Microscillaceae bacterium]